MINISRWKLKAVLGFILLILLVLMITYPRISSRPTHSRAVINASMAATIGFAIRNYFNEFGDSEIQDKDWSAVLGGRNPSSEIFINTSTMALDADGRYLDFDKKPFIIRRVGNMLKIYSFSGDFLFGCKIEYKGGNETSRSESTKVNDTGQPRHGENQHAKEE